MFAVLKSLSTVTSAEYLVLGLGLCILFFTGVYFMFKTNRSKVKAGLYIMSMFLLLEVCDVLWLNFFFPNGSYYNNGFGSSMMMFLVYPFLLVINLLVFTMYKKKLTNTYRRI